MYIGTNTKISIEVIIVKVASNLLFISNATPTIHENPRNTFYLRNMYNVEL